MVGIVVLATLAGLAYPAVRLGKRDLFGGGGYRVMARFDTVGGLRPGARVEIAGVPVGQVESVRLDRRYDADVTMRIANGVVLHDDGMGVIESAGPIGEEYVAITPGTSATLLRDGGRLQKTKDAVSLEDMIAQFIQGKV